MTYIYLGAHSSWYYATTFVTITVKTEDYKCSNLFKIYKHELNQHTGGDIYIYKVDSYIKTFTKNCATLQPGTEYKNSKLASVDVYVNRFDSTNSKLLVVFYFENGLSTVDNKYYPYSELEPLINDNSNIRIKSLHKYNNDESILCALLQENDRLNDVLTYDIMKRPNGNGDGCTYNCGKIQVTKDTTNGDGEPKPGSGFTRFKHTPATGNGDQKSKKACIVYNCNALLDDSGTKELVGVQGKPYSCITVYFGGKAKRACTDKCKAPGAKACTQGTGEGSACSTATASAEQTCTTAPGVTSQCQDVPLMIALQRTNGGGNNTDYYVHRRETKNGGSAADTYYWVKLENSGDNGNGLKQLLTEIGLPEQLKAGNGTLQAIIVPLLKRLQFDLTDSVVILLDRNKTNGHNGEYGDGDITSAIKNLQPTENSKWINPLKLSNGDNKIKVTDNANNGQTKCLENHKYRVVEHDFGNAVSGLTSGCHAGLRFLMPTKDGKPQDNGNGGNYAQLKIYSTDKTDAQHLEYLYYSKNGGTGAQNGTKVYVVFYQGDGVGGTDHDPRPLLLCYGKQAYKPKDKEEYDQTWVKVTGLTPEKCLCQNGDGGDTDTANQALLGAVTEVVGFLNRVQLQVHPGMTKGAGQGCQSQPGVPGGATQCQTTSATSCTYEVHKFQGKPIKVRVTCEAVQGTGTPTTQTCYKKLIHTPIGTGNGGTSNANTGFRLGDVAYCRNGDSGPKGKIDYYGGTNGLTADAKYKYNPLQSVSAYFYDQDTNYQDPLLVVLEFKNGGRDTATEKECYKLTKTANGRLEWEKYDAVKEVVGEDDRQLFTNLNNLRYKVKKAGQIAIHLTHKKKYKMMRNTFDRINSTNGFSPISGTTDEKINVEVCVRCEKLTGAGFECFQHKLSSISVTSKNNFDGLKLFIPRQLPKQSATPSSAGLDQEISLYNIRTNEGTVKDKISNGTSFAEMRHDLDQYTPIYYSICMGDLYVYFKIGDPRPLLVCFNGTAYRPLKLPKPDSQSYSYNGNEDYTKWIRAPEITKCGCEESDKIIKILNEIYDLEDNNIALIAGSSTGGLVAVVSIGGIVFLIFKKVKAVSAATAAAATLTL